MKNIKRDIYLEKIRPFIGKDIIKVLSGQRRVGKSFILKQIQREIGQKDPQANIIDIDLEKYEFNDIKTDKDLHHHIISRAKKGSTNYVFIDEIQEVENFEKVLRNFYSRPDFDIYCTGSNAGLLSGELATYLSGRQIEFNIHPLSFKEFLQFHALKDHPDSLEKYLVFGGMPYLMNLQLNKDLTDEYLQNVLNTILLRDIVTRYKIRDTVFLRNLIDFLGDNIGSLVSATAISKYLKSQNIHKTTQVVLDYLHYIQNSFMIRKARRYDIRGKRIFESNEKFYFEDLGLRNLISGFNIRDINKVMENVVYNHLLITSHKVYVGSLNKMEIDFVAEKGGEKVYIQVAYKIDNEETAQREFGNLLKINDNYRKMVVTMDTFTAPSSYQGIQHFTLYDFLKNWP